MMIRRNGKRNSKGVVAIEFAIGAAAFFMMIFYWMEVSYLGFVSATVDFAVAEAGRTARTGNSEDYEKLFKKALDKNDSLWGQFVDTKKLEVGVNYFSSIEKLQGCTSVTDCSTGILDPIDSPLAIYRVEYPYQPLIAQTFFPSLSSMTIGREMIAVQEYQRSEFHDNK